MSRTFARWLLSRRISAMLWRREGKTVVIPLR